MSKLYFIPGSQDLYGAECLKQVAADVAEMVKFLNEKLEGVIEVEQLPTVETSDICIADMKKAQFDDDCVGVITWMHTFSPAKMWIKGLQELKKPLLHLHTQANEKLPYDKIDMDFMNLNQAAHGDREYGFILARLGIAHEVVAGFYKHDKFMAKVRRFAEVAKSIAYSKQLRVAAFGNNMRDVAVTDGDRVESQIRYGWEVNYYGIGDLVDIINEVSDAEVDKKMAEYESKYTMATDNIASVREQAKYEVALDKFLAKERIGAFTDTFQDLHNMKQLPGIAAQNLMGRGVGFGPEGDYKISAFSAVLMKMAESRNGATGFIEDYTYDLTEGEELELASHMLEVPISFARNKPEIQVRKIPHVSFSMVLQAMLSRLPWLIWATGSALSVLTSSLLSSLIRCLSFLLPASCTVINLILRSVLLHGVMQAELTTVLFLMYLPVMTLLCLHVSQELSSSLSVRIQPKLIFRSSL